MLDDASKIKVMIKTKIMELEKRESEIMKLFNPNMTHEEMSENLKQSKEYECKYTVLQELLDEINTEIQ